MDSSGSGEGDKASRPPGAQVSASWAGEDPFGEEEEEEGSRRQPVWFGHVHSESSGTCVALSSLAPGTFSNLFLHSLPSLTPVLS